LTNQYEDFAKIYDFSLSANPGIGYQILVNVEYQTGMDTNFADLRFSDADNQLSYWVIPDSIESTSCTVLVKLASTSTDLFMHWSKSGATSESTLNALEFGDVFSGETLDAKWTSVYSVSVSSGVAVFGEGGYIGSTTPFGRGHQIIARSKSTPAGDWGYFSIGFGAMTGNNVTSANANPTNRGYTYIQADDGSATSTLSTHAVDNDYHRYTLSYTTNAVMTIDGAATTHSTNIPDTALTVNISSIFGSVGELDYIVIRKFTGSDPTITWGTIQDVSQSSAPVAGFTSVQIFTVNFTDTSTNTPTSWDWDFGDETTHGDTANPTHTYAEAGTYTVVLTATNAEGSDEYSFDVTVGGSGNTVTIVRIHEMDHVAGSTQKHIVRIVASDGSGYLNGFDSSEINAYIDGEPSAGNPLAWAISSFDNTISGFWVTVPSTFETSFGQNINVIVSCYDAEDALIGEGELHLNVVSATGGSAPSVAQIWSAESRTLTAVPTGGALTTDISALNDLSASDIETAVGTAISAAALATTAGLSSVGGKVDLIKTTTDLLTADPLAAIKAQAASALADFDTATPIAKTSELATITGSGTATLASLETDIAAITGGGNAEQVIHPDYYTLNASAKTITLSSPYNTVTVEQVLRIKDLTTNYLIYDCEDSKYNDIPISIDAGVLTYTAPARDAANTDIIQITVNMV